MGSHACISRIPKACQPEKRRQLDRQATDPYDDLLIVCVNQVDQTEDPHFGVSYDELQESVSGTLPKFIACESHTRRLRMSYVIRPNDAYAVERYSEP